MQARVDVERALAAAGLLDNRGNSVPATTGGMAPQADQGCEGNRGEGVGLGDRGALPSRLATMVVPGPPGILEEVAIGRRER